MKIAVVGATGLVGAVMLEELASGDFDILIDVLIPIASERSAGKEIEFRDEFLSVVPLRKETIPTVDIALFSAGADIAKEFAPLFVEKGAFVIDNSSAFRRDTKIPLVVPEVNPETIGDVRLIANPNCSTIQLVVALAPLKKFGIKSLWVATYQAISGAKRRALIQFLEDWEDMWDWLEGRSPVEITGKHPQAEISPQQNFSNVVPAIGEQLPDGEFTEERKLRFETKRILGMPDLPVSATAVRVPVLNGHSEAVTVEFDSEVCIADIILALQDAPGIIVSDESPTPIMVSGRRKVFVGRIRRDTDRVNSFHLWIVADNLRKGAATNAIQIAEKLSVASR